MRTRHRQRMLDNAALDAVMNTPELLNAILSHLDQRTLLTSAQLVSKYWASFIKNSPTLQRCLFFQAEPQPLHDGTYDEEKILSPLLAETFGALIQKDEWAELMCGDDNKGPLARSEFERILLDKKSRSKRKALFYREASWRRMLVSQPPVHKLGCWAAKLDYGAVPADADWTFKILEFPSGLRMGKLYDLVQEWVGTQAHGGFHVHWTPHNLKTLRGIFDDKPSRMMHAALKILSAEVDALLVTDAWGWSGRPMPRLEPYTKELRAFNKKFAWTRLRSQHTEPAEGRGLPKDFAFRMARELLPFASPETQKVVEAINEGQEPTCYLGGVRGHWYQGCDCGSEEHTQWSNVT